MKAIRHNKIYISCFLILIASCSHHKSDNTVKVHPGKFSSASTSLASRNLANARTSYTDDLKVGDFVVIDNLIGCKWRNRSTDESDDNDDSTTMYYPNLNDNAPYGKYCFGKISTIVTDMYYEVDAVTGYQPAPHDFRFNSHKEIHETLKDVNRKDLSIPLNGFCVKDSKYCIGNSVELLRDIDKDNEGKPYNALIIGIFPDGSVAVQVNGIFSYNARFEKPIYKNAAYYYYRRKISEVRVIEE